MPLSLHEVEEAIERFPRKEQQQLLAALPRLLKLSAMDLATLQLAERAFQFWENPDDAIYDTL